MTKKIYLEIPYDKKELAKQNKCKWCPAEKKWWCENSDNKLVETYLKTYFDIPYDAKDRAKELGARWDMESKSWYSYQGNNALRELLDEDNI